MSVSFTDAAFVAALQVFQRNMREMVAGRAGKSAVDTGRDRNNMHSRAFTKTILEDKETFT